MNGKEAYEAIRGRESGIRALFISGRGDDGLVKKKVAEDGGIIIDKPIRPDLLLGQLRRLIDS